MVRKVGIGIFIAIFVIFLMSHNASAISPVIDLSNYELVRSSYAAPLDCDWVNMRDTISSGNNYCRGTVNNSGVTSGLTHIYTSTTYSVKKGDILTFYMLMESWNNTKVVSTQLLTLTNAQLGWNVLDYTVQAEGDISPEYVSSGYADESGVNYNLSLLSNGYSGFYKLYQVSLIAVQDGDLHFGLNNTTGNSLFSWNIIDYGRTINVKISDFKQYRFSGDEANKEQQQKTQEAVDQSTADGNSSQTSVEGSTQSLMSAGGSIISALVNAPATDCNINVQTTGSSRLFTTAIGQLNLCSDVPQGVLTMVQGIVALVFTPIVLYFTYNVLTTLYNQFKEYNS